MDFAERLHCIACRCQSVFSNAKLVNCFKEGLPIATSSLLKYNLRGLPASTRHDPDRFKHYSLTTGSADHAIQASSASTCTLSTRRQHPQTIHHIRDDISMDSFPTSPPMLLSSSVTQTTHDVHPTNLSRIQVIHCTIAEILEKMEHVLNIFNTNKALSESLRTHLNGLFGDTLPIVQPGIKFTDLTKQ